VTLNWWHAFIRNLILSVELSCQDLRFIIYISLSTNHCILRFFVKLLVADPPLLLQILNCIFEDADEKLDQLRICSHTYVIKVKPTSVAESAYPQTLVAFSGSKYVLVCRSLTKYIIVQTEGRRGQEWLYDAVKWLSKLGQKLIDKKY